VLLLQQEDAFDHQPTLTCVFDPCKRGLTQIESCCMPTAPHKAPGGVCHHSSTGELGLGSGQGPGSALICCRLAVGPEGCTHMKPLVHTAVVEVLLLVRERHVPLDSKLA
jgi:hypothetical protein